MRQSCEREYMYTTVLHVYHFVIFLIFINQIINITNLIIYSLHHPSHQPVLFILILYSSSLVPSFLSFQFHHIVCNPVLTLFLSLTSLHLQHNTTHRTHIIPQHDDDRVVYYMIGGSLSNNMSMNSSISIPPSSS
jgi:hypothetical protein